MLKEANGLGAVGAAAGIGGLGGYFTADKNATFKQKIKRAAGGAGIGAGIAGLGSMAGAADKAAASSSEFKSAAGGFGRNAGEDARHGAGANEDFWKNFRNRQSGRSSGGQRSGGTGGQRSRPNSGPDTSPFGKAKDKFKSEFDGMSAADAKKHYRKQARAHHPDAGGDTEAFKGLNSAYQEMFGK